MATLSQIAQDALALSPVERLRLVETLLENLEPPDPETMKKWAAEADARYEAYKRGEIEAKDWDAIRAELRR